MGAFLGGGRNIGRRVEFEGFRESILIIVRILAMGR